MNKHSYLSLLLAAALLLPLGTAQAQDKKDAAKWEVDADHGPQKEITFTTNEGTWMSVDVSPDGKEIVFDMLGDIYIMPASGGKATLLKGGRAYEVQPRFSPNGQHISYTSDKGGGDNIWTMKRDGSEATPGNQRKLPPAEQCRMDTRWRVPCCPQTLYQYPLAGCRRNVDVPPHRWQRRAAHQAQKRPAGCRRAGSIARWKVCILF